MPEMITVQTCVRVYPKDADPHRCSRAGAEFVPFVSLVYDPADPLGISIMGWMFLREHLHAALQDLCADGPYVHVHREGAELRLTARGGDGEVTLWVASAVVGELLARSLKVVPFGEEFAEVDWAEVGGAA